LIDENKINVVKANQSKVNKLTKDFNIEKGEAEALELAREKKCISATDDGPSIKLCKILDIEFTTAIHFLIRFYEKGILNKKIAMEKLKMLEKYGRYDYDIIKDAKNRIGGK
jgi:predicted nucleic acid-binding protein